MSKYKTAILFLAILIIAIFFRTYHLRTAPPGLYPDEAINGNNALETITTGEYKVFYPENNGREGLFINLQAAALKIAGQNEPWVLRSVSALFGILTVLGVYLVASEMFRNNKKIALLSSFLLATSFWHINFSRIGFRAIMAPLFLTWALYFLLKAFRNLHSKSYILNSIFSGILYGFGFHSYIAYRATPPLILLVFGWYFFQNKDWLARRRILLAAGAMSLAAFLVFLPLGRYFWQNPADFLGRTSQVSVFSSSSPLKDLGLNILKTAGMFNVAGDFNWRHNYAGKPELFWPVGILFLLGTILGLAGIWKFIGNWKLRRSGRSHDFSETSGLKIKNLAETILPFAILFGWLFLAALPVVISNEGLPHALRSVLMIPPVFILAGYGGVWLGNKLATKLRISTKIRSAVAVIFLLWLIGETYNAYFIRWAQNPNTRDAFAANYAELGRGLNRLPREIPKYVVVNAGGVDARGIPMPAQTVMFITDTFTPEKQKAKNIYYILPQNEVLVPADALKFYLQ